MSYSIFEYTMVDMPYTEIEKAAENKSVVLLPISVVEEHGPHLCLGTDIYLTQTISEKIQKNLCDQGVPTVIAPPFYWGVNSMTNGFAGSFSIKPSTMITLLREIFDNVMKWGFSHIILLNFHGDFVHINTIMKAAEQAYLEEKIPVHFVNDENIFVRLGVMKDQPYLTKVSLTPDNPKPDSDTMEIHAGGFETSWMIHSYKDLVNLPVAKTLQSSHTGMKELMEWARGGEAARKITPLGYFGNPSNIDLTGIERMEEKTVQVYSDAIAAIYRNSLDIT